MKDALIAGGVGAAICSAIVATFYMAMTVPSCEDEGKESVFLYFMPMVSMAGSTPVTNMVPVYGCR